MIDYHVRIAPRLLPHLERAAADAEALPERRRRAVLLREALPAARAGLDRARDRARIPYCVIDGLASLVWVANLASLELHPSLAMAAAPEVPTVVAFDLDPGAPADVVDCARLGHRPARHARPARPAVLPEDVGLEGHAGVRAAEHADHLRRDASLLAGRRASRWSGSCPTASWRRWRSNGAAARCSSTGRRTTSTKTTIAAYSLRAMPEPTVSTPVTWDEVEDARTAARPDVHRGRRADRDGDPFAPVATLQQELPSTCCVSSPPAAS